MKFLLILILISGCVDVVTAIPDVSALPTITQAEVMAVLSDYNVKGMHAKEFGKEIYYIPTLEQVKEVQRAAYMLISKSPYDGQHRNCVDFAEALKPIMTWTLPSAPIGVIFYTGICRVPSCSYTQFYGHGLLIFVTQGRKVMFVEPRIDGRIYELDTLVIINEVRMAPEGN